MKKQLVFVVFIILILLSVIFEKNIFETEENDLSEIDNKELYQIYNDWGQSQKDSVSISPDLLAKNYYIILDTSGSMKDRECVRSGDKMQAAKVSLSKWIGNLSPDDNIALMVFSDTYGHEILPLHKNIGEYKKQFLESIAKVQARGGTPLGSSLKNAYDSLKAQAETQLGYGEYHIVVVTDGNASDRDVMKESLGYIYNSPVVLHTIGFCIDSYHALNQPSKSYYISAMDEVALSQGLDRVLAESERFDISDFESLQ
tara:strand:- start:6 stop:779 length:774 start_codon:yes stop_codon:yes gene_type:complete